MSIINALTWYIFVTPPIGGARQSIEAVSSIKITLMYLPLLALAAAIILWFLRKCNIIPKQIQFLSYKEEDSSANNNSIKSVLNQGKKSQVIADDDLFSRAAEQNSSFLTMTSSEVGITIQTNETALYSTKN